MAKKILCFLVKVPTTNHTGDTFAISGRYYDCRNGEVYIFAPSIAEAAAMVPIAEEISYAGFGFSA